MRKRADTPFCAYGWYILRPLLGRFLQQIEGIRNSRDPDYVHDMRVASRRLRAALPVFASCLPRRSYRRTKKDIRRMTRALGRARDRDVQILFLKEVLSRTEDARLLPGLEYLLRLILFERNLLQRPIQEELDRLEHQEVLKQVRDMADTFSPPSTGKDFARDRTLLSRARKDIDQKISDLLGYEPALRDPEAVAKHHAMRIAAKHLRYTMEVYSPLLEGDLLPAIKKIRKLQDALGELHDTDVWIGMIPQFLEKEQELLGDALDRSHLLEVIEPGILYLQAECRTLRQAQYSRAVERWDEIREEEVLEDIRGILVSRIREAGRDTGREAGATGSSGRRDDEV